MTITTTCVVFVVIVYGLASRPKFYILRSNINRIPHLYEIYYKQLRI